MKCAATNLLAHHRLASTMSSGGGRAGAGEPGWSRGGSRSSKMRQGGDVAPGWLDVEGNRVASKDAWSKKDLKAKYVKGDGGDDLRPSSDSPRPPDRSSDGAAGAAVGKSPRWKRCADEPRQRTKGAANLTARDSTEGLPPRSRGWHRTAARTACIFDAPVLNDLRYVVTEKMPEHFPRLPSKSHERAVSPCGLAGWYTDVGHGRGGDPRQPESAAELQRTIDCLPPFPCQQRSRCPARSALYVPPRACSKTRRMGRGFVRLGLAATVVGHSNSGAPPLRAATSPRLRRPVGAGGQRRRRRVALLASSPVAPSTPPGVAPSLSHWHHVIGNALAHEGLLRARPGASTTPPPHARRVGVPTLLA
jgi:hypothetical protein